MSVDPRVEAAAAADAVEAPIARRAIELLQNWHDTSRWETTSAPAELLNKTDALIAEWESSASAPVTNTADSEMARRLYSALRRLWSDVDGLYLPSEEQQRAVEAALATFEEATS